MATRCCKFEEPLLKVTIAMPQSLATPSCVRASALLELNGLLRCQVNKVQMTKVPLRLSAWTMTLFETFVVYTCM